MACRWLPDKADFSIAAPSVEEAIKRVAKRVQQGGHSIPEATIRRRYITGLQNVEQIYRQRVDLWQQYENSDRILRLLREGPQQ